MYKAMTKQCCRVRNTASQLRESRAQLKFCGCLSQLPFSNAQDMACYKCHCQENILALLTQDEDGDAWLEVQHNSLPLLEQAHPRVFSFTF